MTKKSVLKLAMTVVATFMFTALMGQVEDGNFGLVSEDENISRITVGKAMPFYVQPDSDYHPDYVGPDWDLTPGFQWNWTSTAFGDQLTLGAPVGNYVEITANTEGDYSVTVREQAPAAWGGCPDSGEGQTMTIRVVPVPLINSYSAMIGEAAVSFESDLYQQCGAIVDFRTSVNLTGFSKFEVRWSLVQRELDVNGDPVGSDNIIVDGTVVEAGDANSLDITTASYLIDAGRELALIDGTQRTRYTFEITEITDHVSRRSDYLGAKTWYGDPLTFTVIVNPAPETGPIFHIPNDFNAL